MIARSTATRGSLVLAVIAATSAAAAAQLVRDANCDGAVDQNDRPALVDALFEPPVPPCPSADANRDGRQSAADLIAFASGPRISYIGIASPNGIPASSLGRLPDGVPVYFHNAGFGFLLVVEAVPPPTGAEIGLNTFDSVPRDPLHRPDFQILVEHSLGDGSRDVCDEFGVPEGDPLDFAMTQEISNAINDLACRFEVATVRGRTCTLDRFEQPNFVNPLSRAQFCVNITGQMAFPNGETRISVQIRDRSGMLGPLQQMVLQVQNGPPPPTFTPAPPTATRTATETPPPTPTVSLTPTATATHTASVTRTATVTRTHTAPPTRTATSPFTPTSPPPTVTRTPTRTDTAAAATATLTATSTATGVTPTHTATGVLPTPTRTATRTPIGATPTRSRTAAATDTATAIRTATRTATAGVTPTSGPNIQINLDSGSAAQGGSVVITASLITGGREVAAAGNSITYDHTAFSLSLANCEPRAASMRTLSGGVVGTSGNMTTVRIVVLGAPLNTDPLPDGPLYSCTFDIRGGASTTTHTLAGSNHVAQDSDGLNLRPVTGSNGSITVTPGDPTPTRTGPPVETTTVSPTPTATVEASGPVITFLGLARADDVLMEPAGMSGQIPIYQPFFGYGFSLIVEAKPGESRAPVGSSTFDDFDSPDLQVQVTRSLGDGSDLVCDDTPPLLGGVPAINPPVLTDDPSIADRLNDLSCRFIDGTGRKIGRACGEVSACVLGIDGQFRCVAEDTILQYCGFIGQILAFPQGDTTVTVRVRDVRGNLGPPRQLIVRVP